METPSPAPTFTSLNLDAQILRAVTDMGYTQPTPIQLQAIPHVLAGRDLMAMAQTGTGKTAAFTLPLLQRLLPHASTSVSPAKHPVRALVLAPTRELAIQVNDSVKDYSQHLPLRSTVVYGGTDIRLQKPELMKGIEILVATPGRLLDHVEGKNLLLNQVQVLILDEADRMLDMGFMPDLKRILALLPKQRQTLLFSATFSDEIRRLAQEFLNNPVSVEVARRNTPAETVQQSIMLVNEHDKFEALCEIIRSRNIRQVLVFTRTKISAARLARRMERAGIAASDIHGDRSQQERLKALDAFKDGNITALVATDVAARGLDIDQLPLVINYELPPNPEDYVHRIGRTGRAGASGEALSLVDNDEEKLLKQIETMLKRNLPRERPLVVANPHASSNARAARYGEQRHGRRKVEPVDDWFLRPYEPVVGGEAAPEVHEQRATEKPKKQVAALLGGGTRKQ
jgi:superfamily II DNA/RNA helicase